jgi:hypothetical protein
MKVCLETLPFSGLLARFGSYQQTAEISTYDLNIEGSKLAGKFSKIAVSDHWEGNMEHNAGLKKADTCISS